jgi:hypothetical protein
MQQTRIEALRLIPIFGDIRRDMLEFLVHEAEMTTARSGQYFFRENDKATAMFVMEHGEVSILKSWNKKQYEIGRLFRRNGADRRIPEKRFRCGETAGPDSKNTKNNGKFD